jgi:hypothetical protein
MHSYFCLQPDNTFVVRNLGNLKNDPSDDANIVQTCAQVGVIGPDTIQLHTAATSNSPYCTTIVLQLAPDPPVFPTGCPSSTVPIPPGQIFRVRSLNFGNWLLGPQADQQPDAMLTSDLEAATLFSVSGANSDRIVYGGSATQLFEAYYKGQYGGNSGIIDFGPLDQGVTPVLFCLQPDNTFTLFSTGDDGLQTEDDDIYKDPTVAVTCPQEQGSVYNVFIDNGIYIARNPSGPCYPDTLVYEPVRYEPPVGCPSTTIPTPANVEFRIRSTAQQTATENVWLLTTEGGQGPLYTTNSSDLATRFSPSTDGTGRIQVISSRNSPVYTVMAPFNRNSGYIMMLTNEYMRPPVQFCLQSDGSFFVRSDGQDEPGLDDPSSILTCTKRDQLVMINNGSYDGSFDPTCKKDTLFYEKIPV